MAASTDPGQDAALVALRIGEDRWDQRLDQRPQLIADLQQRPEMIPVS